MRDIISDIKLGNLKAFKEFFDDYYIMLCVFAAKYLKDDEQCKDVAQEALADYWERRERFGDIYLEKYGRELESEGVFEDWVVAQETYLLVWKAVNALPPQMRTIIRYSLDGLTNPQIAKEMGIGEGSVKSLKQTAYRKLREQLKEHFYLLLLFC